MISISYMFLNEVVLPNEIQKGMITTKTTDYDRRQKMSQDFRRQREDNLRQPNHIMQVKPQRPIPAMGAI